MSNVSKSDEQWREELSPEQYKILREAGTEPAFTGKYVDWHENGEFACAACGNVLFDSGTKFDSKTGWPSFYDAKPGSVELKSDKSLFMKRTEVLCANCGGHLGHLFEKEGFDVPTDQRYCINSLSLQFKPEEEK